MADIALVAGPEDHEPPCATAHSPSPKYILRSMTQSCRVTRFSTWRRQADTPGQPRGRAISAAAGLVRVAVLARGQISALLGAGIHAPPLDACAVSFPRTEQSRRQAIWTSTTRAPADGERPAGTAKLRSRFAGVPGRYPEDDFLVANFRDQHRADGVGVMAKHSVLHHQR